MRFHYELLIVSFFISQTYSTKNEIKGHPKSLSINVPSTAFAQVSQKNNEKKEKTDLNKDELTKNNSNKRSTPNQIHETKKSTDKTKIQTDEIEDQIKSSQTKSTEIDISLIKKDIEKYHKIDKRAYKELCSDHLLNNSPAQTLHLSGKNMILILDDYNLTFKFDLNELNKFYPKLTKLPHRCTSYCEFKKKHPNKNDTKITRFKYKNYLIEFLNLTDHKIVKFYRENLTNLEHEDQSKHLVDVLTFTIENDGCTSPVTNPELKDYYVDDLVTKNLIKIFCNKKISEKLNTTDAFLIQEQDNLSNSIFKIRNMMFFTYPILEIYNLTTDYSNENIELEKNNLPNPVKGIKNAVQIKNEHHRQGHRVNEKIVDKVLFITFTNQNMFILQKSQKETQLVEQPPIYAIQNYYTCPEPLCLDPYFDDLFIAKSCDFDLMFDFLPKASKLLFAFRGNYFYLINSNAINAPKIDQAIPIDYMFKEILSRPEIDFNYLNAAEFVEKSKVIILFKDEQYLLIDPLNKIVNGPFNTNETFKYCNSIPETVFMDDDHLVVIQKNFVIRYLWSAPILTGKRDFILDNYISFKSMSEIDDNDANEEVTIVDAAYKENENYFLFIDDSMIELKFDKDGKKQTKIKDVSTEFFHNCKKLNHKSGNHKKQLLNTDKILGNIRNSSIERNELLFRDLDSTVTFKSTTSSSSSIQLNLLVPFLILVRFLFL